MVELCILSHLVKFCEQAQLAVDFLAWILDIRFSSIMAFDFMAWLGVIYSGLPWLARYIINGAKRH